MTPYVPKQGDIVIIDFTPQTGHEQMGTRPGLVVSSHFFNNVTNMIIVCPITNTIKPFPLHVPLDGRTKTTGVVLCEQLKSLDYLARHAILKEKAPEDILQACLERIHMCIEPDI